MKRTLIFTLMAAILLGAGVSLMRTGWNPAPSSGEPGIQKTQIIQASIRNQIPEAMALRLVELKAPGVYVKEGRSPFTLLEYVDPTFYQEIAPLLRKVEAGGGEKHRMLLIRALARKLKTEQARLQRKSSQDSQERPLALPERR